MASAALSIANLSLQGNKGFSEFAGLRRSSASLFSAQRTSQDFASLVAFQTSAAAAGRIGYRRGPVEAKLKVAVNGFGRTGMNFMRFLQYRADSPLEVVAINDTAGPKQAAHLLKYDSNFGILSNNIKPEGNDSISIDGRIVKMFSESDPTNLPWKDLGIDLVIEATGKYLDKEGAGKHLNAGAKKVIITELGAEDIPAYISGVNSDTYNPAETIISCTSPTTVCVAPLLKVLQEKFGIKKGTITAVHSYTNEQKVVDSRHDTDPRFGRAAAPNVVPTTANTATAVARVLPYLSGKLNSLAFRVPIPNVSAVDLVLLLSEATTAEDVNTFLKERAQADPYGLIGVTNDPVTSVDLWATDKSTVDPAFTMALGGDMIKLVAWFDNEWGYTMNMINLGGILANTMS